MIERSRIGTLRALWLVCLGALLAALVSPRAWAQESAQQPAPQPAQGPAEQTPAGSHGYWGFNGTFGTGSAGGDFGNLFTKPVSWDYSFFRQKGPWRAGIGLTFASFKMKEPYQDELEWGHQEIYLFGTRFFNTKGTVRPYIKVQGGIARLRPRSELFKIDPLPPDFVSGQHIIEKTDGFGLGVIPGVEFKISRAAFLDASVAYTYFNVAEYDLSPVGQPPRSTGSAFEGRLGITWLPNGGQHEQGGEGGGTRDAWGVKQSYGWAAGEVLAINNLGGVAAQWIRDVDWSETNPRSWWDNIKTGFTYDPDTFKTNQWSHPFNGAAYYNSSRSNGVSYWPSAAFAVAGAFEWECCGETQRMSFNDMIATPIGGIALGETQYRLSSEILNNQSTGMGRFWREFGGFFVDPIREVNRIIRGDATKVADNPVDPMDWRPKGKTFVATGVRSIGEGSSITNNTKSYATILLNHTYGDVFENTRRKPFDYIDMVAEMNFGEKVALGNVQIRGDIASWPLGGSQSDHVLEVVQHFDYMNNTAYEFGGQSVGASLSSRFRLSDTMTLKTRVDGDGIILAGINSEYAHNADVANPERLREYDYGPGLGAMASANLVRKGNTLLGAAYRFAWVSVTNGSVYNKGNVGSDADHYIQSAGVRLVIPIKGSVGLGGDAYLFLRNSHFSLTDSVTGRQVAQHITQRNPQARVYLAFNP